MVPRLKPVVAGALVAVLAKDLAAAASTQPSPAAPLQLVADAPMPGAAVRFDYQSLDPASGRLYISHMNADQLVVFDTRSRKVVANLEGFARVRGVLVVPQLKRAYVAARGAHQVVVVDTDTLQTLARVGAIPDPDGLAYAPKANRLFVSDEQSKADAVIDARTNGLLTSIPLGGEPGNTVYDAGSDRILVAVAEPAELAVIEPASARIVGRVPLPGLKEPHGIALDVAHRLAFVAGQGNHTLAVLDLESRKVLATHPVGEAPDVLAFDAGVGRLFVASESGTVSVFRESGKELVLEGEMTMPHAHSVCVDPTTHLVYFPLEDVDGHPLLRIMEVPSPAGPRRRE